LGWAAALTPTNDDTTEIELLLISDTDIYGANFSRFERIDIYGAFLALGAGEKRTAGINIKFSPLGMNYGEYLLWVVVKEYGVPVAHAYTNWSLIRDRGIVRVVNNTLAGQTSSASTPICPPLISENYNVALIMRIISISVNESNETVLNGYAFLEGEGTWNQNVILEVTRPDNTLEYFGTTKTIQPGLLINYGQNAIHSGVEATFPGDFTTIRFLVKSGNRYLPSGILGSAPICPPGEIKTSLEPPNTRSGIQSFRMDGRHLYARGYAILNMLPPENPILLRLTDIYGNDTYYPAQLFFRQDIASYFKDHHMGNTGFEIFIFNPPKNIQSVDIVVEQNDEFFLVEIVNKFEHEIVVQSVLDMQPRP
jgi:hypothetical protein